MKLFAREKFSRTHNNTKLSSFVHWKGSHHWMVYIGKWPSRINQTVMVDNAKALWQAHIWSFKSLGFILHFFLPDERFAALDVDLNTE